jgi:hypothetical protein
MNMIELLKQVLEALENEKALNESVDIIVDATESAITSLRQAIAELEKQDNCETEKQELCPSCKNGSIYACTCTFKTSRNTLTDDIAELEKQEHGDYLHQENDGCPAELSVLQRFWRGQDIPVEHQPSWFKQEPVAWYDTEEHGRIIRDIEAAHGIGDKA